MYDSHTRGAVGLPVIGPGIGVPSALPGQFSPTNDAHENRSNDFWASSSEESGANVASNGRVERIGGKLSPLGSSFWQSSWARTAGGAIRARMAIATNRRA